MTNYLTHPDGVEVDEVRPLPVDDVSLSSDRISISSEAVTFNSPGAIGSVGINAFDKKPILDLYGGSVGSFWGEKRNLVIEFTDTGKFGTLTETNGSASMVITDTNNLATLFETASGNRRYILKAVDSTGASIYGYIGDITSSGSTYTIPIHDALSGGNQNWKNDISSFDNSNVERVEIYSVASSLVWGTGTVLTREVALPKIKAKGGLKSLFDNFANGDFAVDYQNGMIYFKKATTGTSDTVSYSTYASVSVSVSSSGGNPVVQIDDASTASSSGYPVFAIRDDALSSLAPAEGDWVPFRVDSQGALYVRETGPLTVNDPTSVSKDVSSALEASSVSKNSSGSFYGAFGVIDASAPTDIYYVQILDASSVPSNGAVTHLVTPIPINHTTGTDSSFSFGEAFSRKPVSASSGVVIVLSTTLVTLTISSSYLFSTVLYT